MMRRVALPAAALACMAALTLHCFGAALLRHEQFGYRDAGHFYYPLYQLVESQWDAGLIPLWEPEENAGMPLLGNPSAAVLYPGKVLFRLAPSYPWGARIYIIAHVLMCVGSMYALGRSWSLGRAASMLAGLGYGFGGPILFQNCNVIFLVGAAWAPLGLRAADRWLRLGRRWALVELAFVLAMQTLGGDPESAYLTGVCAGGYALALARRRTLGPEHRGRPWLWAAGGLIVVVAWIGGTLLAGAYLPQWRPKPKFTGEPPTVLPWLPFVPMVVAAGWGLAGAWLLWRAWKRPGPRPLLKGLAGLAAAAGLAGLLSAAQLLPVFEFSAQSVRAAGEGPHDIYPFSLEAYRALELVWPNVYGTDDAGHRSWTTLVPPKVTHREWVPSLYLGGPVLVLALSAFGFRGGPPWRGWLSVIALASLLGSFGEFASPLWWARCVPEGVKALGPHDPLDAPPIREDGRLRDGDGSPYWLLATALPGFGQFRYPSKLLTFTALAVAGLGGAGWDRFARGRTRKALAFAVLFLLASLAARAAFEWKEPAFRRWLDGQGALKTATLFGPLDVSGAINDTRRSLAHGAAVGLALLAALQVARRWPKAGGILALVVLSADLGVANARLVRTVPQADFDGVPWVLDEIRKAEQAAPTPGGAYRVHRMPIWTPVAWIERSSPDRVRDFVRWERGTIQPKYGLPFGMHYTFTEGTTELYDYHWFFSGFRATLDARTAEALGSAQAGQQIVYFTRRGYDLWNTRYFVVPAFAHGWNDEHRGFAAFLPDSDVIYPPRGRFNGPKGDEDRERWVKEQDVQIFRNRAAFPRAWIVHRARFWDPVRGLDKSARKNKMEELLFQDDLFWSNPNRMKFDPRDLAWIEADPAGREAIGGRLSNTPHDPSESATIVKYEPKRVEIDAALYRPGLVILTDVLYPGWRLTIDGKPAPIVRVNRLMRGALVESGRHRLVYEYHPDSFRRGQWLSGAGLVLALLGGLWCWRWPLASWSPGGDRLSQDPSAA